MEDIIINVKNLTKTYKIYEKPIDRLKEVISPTHKKYSRNFDALKDISFEVKKGENIGLIGTNGAGKSTLLKIITGVLSPTSGTVEVKGKISALLELGTGFNMEYTGIENIYLNGTMMGFSKEEMDKKVDSILEFADIGEFIKQPVKTYSSGMFARLAFAVAINVEPEILIVDEALSVGDVRFQMKCMNRMKEMMDGGTTVLFVSHDINAIRRFCTRAIWINSGTMQAEGDTNRVADYYLEFLKTGKFIDDKVIAENQDLPPFVAGKNIAEIISFKAVDEYNREFEEIRYDIPVKIEIIYDVYDESVVNPVIGVAIKGFDDEYICGLNTLLDNIYLPWKYGRNRITLEYNAGLRIAGGRYYFDIAIYDKTATVAIQYKSMIKKFSVVSNYDGEGKLIIPHNWRNNL